MKKNLVTASILLASLIPLLVITQALSNSYSSANLDGKTVFAAANCGNCHSVSTAGIEAKAKSEKMRGPDLAGISARFDAQQLAQYLKKEKDLDGRPHKIAFKGSDEELQALVDWLLEQKAQ